MKKHCTAHVIFAATALASQQAGALGFGRAVSDAVLGQSLTFTVPLRVEPGEHIGLECLSAQVYYGEAPVPSTQVRTELQPGTGDYAWIAKVTTSVPVAEPIVEIALNANCDRPFTRRFSLFADPPTLATTSAPLVSANAGRAAAPAPVPGTAAAPPAASVDAGTGPHAANGAAGARARVVRKGPTMALANELEATPSRRHVAADTGSARKPGPRVAVPPSAEETARLVLDPGVPHLKLDMEEPVVPPAAAVAAASGATMVLSDIDDPDLRKLKALEQSIQALRNDSQLQHERADRLQAQLAQVQSGGSWTPWLLALLAVAAAAIAALLLKLREQNRIAHSDWFNQSQLSVFPPVTPEAQPPAADEAPAPSAPVGDPRREARARPSLEDALPELPAIDDGDARGMPDLAATRPLDRQALAAALAQDSAPRELSVEELLDLEQQADFFIALGQEDAAVDLLMSHLRSAGGQSPIPYTKLLEIYKRQGDRSAYERIRARFNRRFNAYAPDWDTGPTAGRSLEDYPDTIAQLEHAWPSPIDAMAVLEGLLFKRDDTSELFDLPAYRDVLVLYSLARDLWQTGGGDAGTQIDVLLPLDDAARPRYPSAREVNERGLPRRDAGLDLDAVDAEGDTAHGMLTSFELTGFQPGPGDGRLDLELPAAEVEAEGGDVHATLDEMHLAPAAPTKPRSPPDWRDSEPPGPDLPAR